MTQEHPITPPPELVNQWCHQAGDEIKTSPQWFQKVATQAARWGADQELEACSQWIHGWYGNGSREVVGNLYAARRPKPPSLKEQALQALDSFEGFTGSLEEVDVIRRALESLPD